MGANHSMQLLLKLNAAFLLCLCLLTAFAASAANPSLMQALSTEAKCLKALARRL